MTTEHAPASGLTTGGTGNTQSLGAHYPTPPDPRPYQDIERRRLWQTTDYWLAQMDTARRTNDPDGYERAEQRWNAGHDELDVRDSFLVEPTR